jgi:DNA invertase Pin-like site-specific DNA recombinase
VLIIDQDQGQSGTSAEHRRGFQQLLAEVTMDHVGIVLGLEMSRLARNSKDWHHLLEVCAIFNTLLGDQDGIYDAQAPNDRLLLGLRGTMSEVELHTMRNRLERGRLNKAARGELFYGAPMGYVRVGKSAVEFDPDEQARDVMHLIFDRFDAIGSLYGLFQYLIRHNIRLPVRAPSGPNKGQLDWRRASLPTLSQVLHHPMYAGAYAHGRRPRDAKSAYSNGRQRVQNWLPMDQWRVLIKDGYPRKAGHI